MKQPERKSADRSELPEGGTNILQTADWRFLLPSPPDGGFRHLVLLGGDPRPGTTLAALAGVLREIGWVREVSLEPPAEAVADVLVILAGGGTSLDHALRCLAAGGHLYAELDRKAAETPPRQVRRLERWLRRRDLRLTSTYWVTPDFRENRHHVPLDRYGSLAWFVRNLRTEDTTRARVEGAVLRVLGRFPHWAACVVRRVALTAVLDGSGGPVLPSVLGAGELPEWLSEGRPSVLMVTSGQDVGSKVVLLPFAGGERRPRAAIKMSRVPAFNAHVENEQKALREIRERIGSDLEETLPFPLASVRYRSLAVGVESVAAGRPMLTLNGWAAPFHRRVRDLDLATSWITRFHRSTESARLPLGSHELQQRLLEVRQRYLEQCGADHGVAELMKDATRWGTKHSNATVPVVLNHADFGPWNVYRHGARLTVIDWESPEGESESRFGPALCDLLYFIAYWSYLAGSGTGRSAELAAFRDAFLARRPSRAGRASRDAIRRYASGIGIDLRSFPLLLLHTFAERSLNSVDRRAASASRDSSDSSDSRAAPATDAEETGMGRFTEIVTLLAEDRGLLFESSWSAAGT